MYSAALVGLKVKNQFRASRITFSRRRSYSFRIRSASACLPICCSPFEFNNRTHRAYSTYVLFQSYCSAGVGKPCGGSVVHNGAVASKVTGVSTGCSSKASEMTSSMVSTRLMFMTLRTSSGTSGRSFSLSFGKRIVSIPKRCAAKSFSFTPPIGSTRPRKVISPVIATFLRTGTRVRAETIATAIVIPADGPSLGIAPSGICTCRSRLRIKSRLIPRRSARALTCIKARAERLGVSLDFIRKRDLHVHIPEGAISKDGPSAGITIAVAMVSALTRVPVRRNVAMTGEITLRGRVLPIGGVKEKLLAAHRFGIDTLLLPKDNEKDLPEVPEEVRNVLNINLVETIDEVIALALEEQPVETAVTVEATAPLWTTEPPQGLQTPAEQ